jgi:hypothetical protein
LSSCTGGPGRVTGREGTRCEKPGEARCPRRAGRLRSWWIETLRGGHGGRAGARETAVPAGCLGQGPREEGRGSPHRRQDAQASGGKNPREDRTRGKAAATPRLRRSDSAGGESLEAESDLQSVRCAPAAPGGSNRQRQAGAVPSRGGATPVEERTSVGSNPEGASPVKETDTAETGKKASRGCESLQAQRRRVRQARWIIVAPSCFMRRGERRPQGRSRNPYDRKVGVQG